MSIPTKGSRRITVNGNEYRWRIRRKATYAQSVFEASMWVAIQSCDAGSTSVLTVNLGVSRPDNLIRPHQTGLTPAAVEDIITRALAAGWNPAGSTSPFELEYGLIKDTVGYVHR